MSESVSQPSPQPVNPDLAQILTQSVTKKYRLWFNTSTISEVDNEWMRNDITSYTIEDINDISRHHTVTHLILNNEFPPNINTLFPHLTHLRICRVESDAHWTSISSLKTLEVLNISYNNLCGGLPDNIFTSLLSLKELNMEYCKLPTLPNSISSLENLEVLNIAMNNLFDGLSDGIFTSLLSLRELNMSFCKLPALPNSMQSLQSLKKLNVSANNITSLPSSVYTLNGLLQLDISYNKSLTSLDPKILQLTQLHELNVFDCHSLISPPLEVCKRGADSARQYYADLAKGAGRNLPFATIAVLGNTMAGKTSLIRTLQSTDRKRVLTNRGSDAVRDETTKVFNVEEVEVDGTVLRLIDMGGQEIYHITYQLTLRQNCIPVIVVNMEQYDGIANESTHREAVRRLAFDYMSHLYLATPTLGPPKLIFTHKDKFQIKEFQRLQKSFLETSNKLCEEIISEEKALGGEFAHIKHFSKSAGHVFPSEGISEVGKDDKYEVFDLIKSSLLKSSQDFVKPLPMVWEEVKEKVLSIPSVYSTFDEILQYVKADLQQIESSQLDIILTYMHDCGKILWYKDISSLRQYIFHRISEVTKLLCVLYHHDPNIWQSRLDKFQPYYSKSGIRVEKQDFNKSVGHFTDTGLMMQCLLFYLIAKETSFSSFRDVNVAVCLLQTFRLLYGPIHDEQKEPWFIVPQFAKNFYATSYTPPKEIFLKTETQFNGLALPQYVYHQMTVGLLELFPDECSVMKVRRNGANVYQDGIYTHLVHDYKSRKLSLQVSSNAANIGRMWEKLITANNNILRHVLKTWPASRPVTTCFCAHCLLLELAYPKSLLSPQWCLRSLKHSPKEVKLCNGSSTTLCNDEEISSALLYPCQPLSERETGILKELVNELKVRAAQNRSVCSVVSCSQSDQGSASATANDDLSDLSDDDENMCPGEEEVEEMKLIRLRLSPTSNSKIKQLFSNTDKVFNMTKKRGRALIINNMNFDKRPDLCRRGSNVDVENMSALMKALKFEVVTHTDLKAKEMLSAVKTEVKKEEHKDLGCHVLVIMTHGGLNNHIYGTDLKRVKLTDVYDLLTPLNFSGMAGKPKVVILEVCSGERSDFGDRGIDRFDIGESQDKEMESISPPFAKVRRLEDAEAMNRLNYDDLLVVKSSMESFISKRHPEYGSLMIRALVSSMYKHACHHDLYTIFKQVQTKVRKLCVDRNLESGGQLVVAWDTLTHMRKLYLFPGFNGYKRGDDS